jgi:predicted ribonuclease YlaK
MSRQRTVKARTKSKNQSAAVYELSNALINNYEARKIGPKAKTWHIRDMVNIQPLTETQKDFFAAFYSGADVIGVGSAGTGKTFISLYLAISDILDPQQPQQKLIIVRSNAASREMGHLPGTAEEKMSGFEAPYRVILSELFGRESTYDDMKEAGIIEFVSTSFIRGMTWSDSFVLCDEIQNLNLHEIDTVVTRLGDTSRLIGVGDIRQTDLIYKKNDVSGLGAALQVFARMPTVSTVTFTKNDIVRSGLCRDWIVAREDLNL